jgi:hypothetical protein
LPRPCRRHCLVATSWLCGVPPAFVIGFPRGHLAGSRFLMPLGLDKIREDRFLAQCLACLKPMQTVH